MKHKPGCPDSSANAPLSYSSSKAFTTHKSPMQACQEVERAFRPDDPLIDTVESIIEAGLEAPPAALEIHESTQVPGNTCIIDIRTNRKNELEIEGHFPSSSFDPTELAIRVQELAGRLRVDLPELATGGQLTLSRVFIHKMGLPFDQESTQFTAHASAWSIQVGGPARFLIAELLTESGDMPPILDNPGNLPGTSTRTARWVFDLKDNSRAILARHKNQWYLSLCFDDQQEDLQQTKLPSFLTALGFLLGDPVFIEVGTLFDQHGRFVGFSRFPTWSGPKTGLRPHPPTLPANSGSRDITDFIDAAIAQLAGPQRRSLLIAMQSLFIATTQYMGMRFRELWIGCEQLAKCGVKTGVFQEQKSTPIDLAPGEAWKDWVDDHKSEILGLANKPHSDALLSRVRAAGTKKPRPNPTIVQRAFKGSGIGWPDRMNRIEKTRHRAVHEGVIRDDHANENWHTSLTEIGLASTMLSAVVARFIGYHGPITDKERYQSAWRSKIVPEWWPQPCPAALADGASSARCTGPENESTHDTCS